MKKISYVALSVLLLSTAAFADATMVVPQILMGKIKSIAPIASAAGKSELVIVDQAGKETQLNLSAKTKISDKSGAASAIAKLAAGEMVKVKMVSGQDASSVQIES